MNSIKLQTRIMILDQFKNKERMSMKEKYNTPEMEIVEFEAEDIITTSGGVDELPFVPFSMGE